jgi:hypothetical protein
MNTGLFFLEVNQPGRETEQRSPSIAEVKNV